MERFPEQVLAQMRSVEVIIPTILDFSSMGFDLHNASDDDFELGCRSTSSRIQVVAGGPCRQCVHRQGEVGRGFQRDRAPPHPVMPSLPTARSEDEMSKLSFAQKSLSSSTPSSASSSSSLGGGQGP